MTFWTVQTKKRYEELLKNGILKGDKNLSQKFWDCDGFARAYEWLVKELARRIKHYPRGQYPVWLWTKRPDFRSYKVTEDSVLLEVDLSPKAVLISHFDAWHMILNGTYLSLNQKEDKQYSNLSITRRAEKKIIEASWNRVFNVSKLKRSKAWGGKFYSLQACTAEIKLTEVRKVQFYSKNT